MRDNFKKWMMPIILIFIIPQLINLIACFMMNDKQLKDIPMAVYMGDQTSLTRQIVKSFDDTETFEIVAYTDSASEVEASMARGETVFGLVIPKDFTKDLKKMKSPTLVTVVDGTQLSTAAFTKLQSTEILLTTKIGAMVNAFKGKFSLSTVEALNTARPIAINSRVIGNPTRNYINFLMPGLMASLIQVGLVMSTASITAPERFEPSAFRKDYLKKLGVFTLAGTGSILFILGVQALLFQVPAKGGIIGLTALTLLFTGAVVSLSMMLSTFFKNKVFATQVAAVYFIPSSIIGGYTWPVVAMPGPIQKLSTIMPFTYFGDFVRAWMLQGEFTAYGRNAAVCFLMIGVAVLASFIFQKMVTSKIIGEAMVLEN